MNRLQKKCLVAAAGMHFLVVVVLLCSGFMTSKPKPDESQVLDVIPSKLVDAALQSGVRSAQPSPPTPPVKPPEPTPPPPEPPKPEVKHIEPPKPVEPVKVQEPIEPEVSKPDIHTEPKPPKPPHKIVMELKPVVRNKTTEPDHREEEAKKAELEAERKAEREAAREAKRAWDARNKAIVSAATSIRDNASSAMNVELHGDNTVAYANYASIVKSVYTQKWMLPDTAANDEANVKVSVTIARDGQVIEAHIIERSGDSSLDASVQRTLDRVRDIAPFPDEATDKERTYIINFNLKAKRLLG